MEWIKETEVNVCSFILKKKSFINKNIPCIIEMDNTHDKHEIAIVNNERVVGHSPIRLSGSHLEAEVTGVRVNRGGRYGLEVPCNYCLTGQEKATEWVKKETTKDHRTDKTTLFRQCLDKIIKICLKNSKVLFMEVNFRQNVRVGTELNDYNSLNKT